LFVGCKPGREIVTRDDVAEREGESLESYIARLAAFRRSGLTLREQALVADALAEARRRARPRRPLRPAVATETPPPAAAARALERCKRAVRSLLPAEREELARWLAQGMPD
jgi:hypothetical protein